MNLSRDPYPLWLLREGYHETFVTLVRSRQIYLWQKIEETDLFDHAVSHIQTPLLKSLLVDPLNIRTRSASPHNLPLFPEN